MKNDKKKRGDGIVFAYRDEMGRVVESSEIFVGEEMTITFATSIDDRSEDGSVGIQGILRSTVTLKRVR